MRAASIQLSSSSAPRWRVSCSLARRLRPRPHRSLAGCALFLESAPRKMNALELITLISQSIYVIVFVLVLWRYIRAATPAHLDMTLFFGILAFAVIESRIAALTGLVAPEWFTDALVVAIVALPYLLLRLLDDFTTVPPILKRAAEVGLLVCAIAMFALAGPNLPGPIV